jgi:hypothetical protein
MHLAWIRKAKIIELAKLTDLCTRISNKAKNKTKGYAKRIAFYRERVDTARAKWYNGFVR